MLPLRAAPALRRRVDALLQRTAAAHPGLLLHVAASGSTATDRSPATARRACACSASPTGNWKRRARRRADARRSSPRRRSPDGPRSTVPEDCRWWRPSLPWSTGGAHAGSGRSRCTRSARPSPRRCSAPLLGWIGGALGAPWGRAGLLALAAVAALVRARHARRARRARAAAPPAGAGLVADVLRAAVRRRPVRRGPGDRVPDLPVDRHARRGGVRRGRERTIRRSARSIVAPFGLVRGLSAIVAWRSVTQERSRALVDRLVASSDARLGASRTASRSS